MRALPTLVFLAFWSLPASLPAADPPGSILVFAAASLTDVCLSIGRLYEQSTGHPVRFSFAGSSTLARQIDYGAPADVFLSANPDWVQFLESRDLLANEATRVFAYNRLVLVARTDLEIDISPRSDFNVQSAFTGRLAIGDPAHVPAGRYARMTFENLGWWTALQGRLAVGPSVRGALAYVERGACDVGVVYATDSKVSAAVRTIAVFPDSLHSPIQYVAGVVTTSTQRSSASDFVAFLNLEASQEVLRSAGFLTVPRVDP